MSTDGLARDYLTFSSSPTLSIIICDTCFIQGVAWDTPDSCMWVSSEATCFFSSQYTCSILVISTIVERSMSSLSLSSSYGTMLLRNLYLLL
jgi:hypothetical protein